ncbi:helix-turn-helix transcriptional regulator [Citrobacter farmeri]|uniref:helix-turn-helix transcriptional regulator n=2 Tax=Gammaproteobacteria TaxID=1236 RepID=UPI00388CFA27|nr:AlpA family transcriptional regulator [Citrobacter farmeri]
MNTNRILRKKEVLHLTGISAATMYRLIAKGTFPIPKKLTGDSGRAVGWGSNEIQSWIESRGISNTQLSVSLIQPLAYNHISSNSDDTCI